MTKYYIIITVLPLLLSSCASVFNSPLQKVVILADKNIKIVSVNKVALIDPTEGRTNPSATYYIPRSSKPVTINLLVDSTSKTVFLTPKNSFAYWYNIPCNYGIGMLVDKDDPKRYAYSPNNYLTLNDTTIKIRRFAPVKKGSLNISLSLPFTTVFNVNAINSHYRSEGILGIEGGVDYFYKENKYLSLNAGAATDRFGEYFGPGYRQSASTVFASLRNNHNVGSFDLGYGISIAEFNWTKQSYDTTKLYESVKTISPGLSLNAEYRLGILYQPALLNTSFKPSLNYQHYLSLNLTWKLPLSRGR